MKKYLIALVAPFALQIPASAAAKEDVQAALQKLRQAPNYTWVTKTEVEGSRFPGNQGAITGKAEKDGFAVITQALDDQTVQVVNKGDKAILKTPEGWKASTELPEIQ